MTDASIKAQIQAWLETVVIALNICPFAHKVHQQNSIYYAICRERKPEHCLEALILECQRLNVNSDITTTLLIYPNTFADFGAYLDFLELAEILLLDQGYEGIYQLASFHPDYRFDDSDTDDPANYTNRSPYPMLHVLREDSLEQALATYPDPENIPLCNIKRTRELGLAKMQALLKACYLIF